MKKISWLFEFEHPWKKKYDKSKIVEYEKELLKCPVCESDLIFQSSHDNIDMYMYCKSYKCNFVGIVRDVYLDPDIDFWKE